MTFDGSQISIGIAFLGGVITFFASCLLPLVPIYLAYLTGITLQEIDKRSRGRVLINAAAFVLGFITVFTILGMTATIIGNVLAVNRQLIQKIGGAGILIMGLFMFGYIKPNMLLKEIKITSDLGSRWKLLNSFFVGLTFGFAWTPCIGPVLATILIWASQTATFWKGAGLLIAYGVGIGLPFLIAGVFLEFLSPRLKSLKKIGRVFYRVSAVIMILIGILLMAGKIDYLSVRLLEFLNLRTLAV